MTSPVTGDQIQQLAASAQPYSLVQLSWTAKRDQQGDGAIELEHQRRVVSLRLNGVIPVLCPVVSDVVAGISIMTQTPEQAAETMAADPCVQAGMMTYEVFSCFGFPGDRSQGDGTLAPGAHREPRGVAPSQDRIDSTTARGWIT